MQSKTVITNQIMVQCISCFGPLNIFNSHLEDTNSMPTKQGILKKKRLILDGVFNGKHHESLSFSDIIRHTHTHKHAQLTLGRVNLGVQVCM